MLEINKILNTDSIEAMKNMESECIDLIVTDPPYKTITGGDSNGKNSERPKGMLSGNRKLFKHQNIKISDWMPEVYRILKNGSHCYIFTNTLNLTEMLNESKRVGFKLHNLLVWEKNNCTPMKAHENVLIFGNEEEALETVQIFYKKLPTYNSQMTEGHSPVHSYTKHTTDGNLYGKTKTGISGGGSTVRYPRDVLQFAWDTQKINLHNCQKPLEACKYFIETYTIPGMVILDSCGGSMSTAVAAIQTKRNYICFEKDREIFNIGNQRVREHLAQQLLQSAT